MSERRASRPLILKIRLGVCIKALAFSTKVLPPRFTVSFAVANGDIEHIGTMERVSGNPVTNKGACAINRERASVTLSPL